MGWIERLKGNPYATQAREVWGRMPRSRRFLAAGATLAVLGVLWYVIALGSRTEYRELARALEPEDAAAVRAVLDQEGIPYRVEEGGVILVPAHQIHEARLDLARPEVLSGGGAGWSLFDRESLVTSPFTQRVNYHRALEGEISRTVRALDEVQKARVHLVLPKQAVFREEQKKPTASVVLKLKPGRQLSDGQVRGIRLLVASAVEGMRPDDVAVLDSTGAALARPGGDPGTIDQSRRLEMERQVARSMEGRIVSMLEPVAGMGRVIARVNVELDFTKRSERIEEYDADSPAVRSERRVSETRGRTRPRAAGTPGSQGNLGDGAGTTTPASENAQRQDEQVNYELNKTVRTNDEPAGRVRRISVGVVLGGRPRAGAATEGGEPAPVEFVPFTDEELGGFSDIVRTTVGYDEKRGDRVVVSNMPFAGVEEEMMLSEPLLPPELLQKVIDWVFLLLAFGALYFAVLRPLLRRSRSSGGDEAGRKEAPAELPPAEGADARLLAEGRGTKEGQGDASASAALPGAESAAREEALPAGEAPAAGLPPGDPEAKAAAEGVPARLAIKLRERAIELSRADTKRAAQVIRSWLRLEEGGRAD